MKPTSRRFNVFGCLLIAALLTWLGVSRLLRPGPDRPWVHAEPVARARRWVERGRPDLAFKILSAVRDRSPVLATALTDTAQAILSSSPELYEHGQATAARRLLERSLDMEPGQPQAAKMLAAICLASGDTSQGMALLRKAAELDPADFRPWFALGRVLREQAQLAESALISAQALEESAADFAEALRRSPPPAETREAQVGRIGALLDISQHERAKNELEVLRRQAADDPRVMALGARLAHDLGRLDEAAMLADRALAIDRANREALMVRARVRFRMRQAERAIEDLEAALAIKGDDLAALRLLSLAQKSAGRARDAEATRRRADEIRESRMKIEKFSRLIAEQPNDPEPRWRMGEAAVEAGLPALAFQSLQAALDLDPNCPQALEHLKKLRARGTSPELMSTVGGCSHGPSTRDSP